MKICNNCGEKLSKGDLFCHKCGTKYVQEESEKQEKKIINEADMMKLLDGLYNKSIEGIGKVSPPIEKFAEDYLKKQTDREKAAKAMLKNQIAKCATSGFITGFGGVITLPVAISANVGSVLYVQMRMIACTAYLAGYDLNSDQVQTFVYACLAGVSVNELAKAAGVKIGVKMANAAIKKIPGKALQKINQKVGFRLVTKFGEKGVVNLGKMVPGVGAIIGGGLDFAETKVIAGRAYKMFFEGDYSVDDGKKYSEEEVIEDAVFKVVDDEKAVDETPDLDNNESNE